MNTNLFTVTPMNHNVNLDPGEVYTGVIKVTNPADATTNFKYKIEVSPYGVTEDGSTANFSKETAYTQIVKWITIDEPEGEVEPNNTKEVKFTITVPENAPGGGQYAAIMVGSNNDSEAGENLNVQNVFEMASLVYAEINGEIHKDAKIEQNNIPGFVTGAPITLGASFVNNGNIHEQALVMISAKDVFTGRVIVSSENESDYFTELIMPESTRHVERNINEGLPLLGIVHVEQSISYGGEFSKEEKNVIICPIWFMALVAVTIGAIIFTIVQIVGRHRKKAAKLAGW